MGGVDSETPTSDEAPPVYFERRIVNGHQQAVTIIIVAAILAVVMWHWINAKYGRGWDHQARRVSESDEKK